MGPCMQLSLSCPSTDKLTLGGPISTEETQAAMLGYDEKFFGHPPAKRLAEQLISLPSLLISCLPNRRGF